MGTANERQRERRSCISGVKHWCSMDKAIRRHQWVGKEHVLGVGQQVGMALHHALRQARRAASVGDSRKRVRGDRAEFGVVLIEGPCRAQIVPMDPPAWSGLYPEVDQVLERGASLLQLAGHLQVRTIGNDGSGPAVVDDEFQFGDGKPVVEIIEHHSRRR